MGRGLFPRLVEIMFRGRSSRQSFAKRLGRGLVAQVIVVWKDLARELSGNGTIPPSRRMLVLLHQHGTFIVRALFLTLEWVEIWQRRTLSRLRLVRLAPLVDSDIYLLCFVIFKPFAI